MTNFQKFIETEISPKYLETVTARVTIAFSGIREERRSKWAKLAQAIAAPSKIRQVKEYDRIRLHFVRYTQISKWFPTQTEWENQGGWRIIDDALRLMLGYYDTLH